MPHTAYTRENPSPRFRELERIYRQVHESGLPSENIASEELFSGRNLQDHVPRVKTLIDTTAARSILDYGSGKGLLYRMRDIAIPGGDTMASIKDYWGVERIRCFDPGVPEFATPPSEPSDGVICTDVLEHVPEEDVPWLLAELFRLADRFVYANIASFRAGKTLPNGWNAHVTVRPPVWWAERIRAAANGWKGEAYEFQVRERKSPIVRLARRICGLNKWKITSIASDPPPQASEAR